MKKKKKRRKRQESEEKKEIQELNVLIHEERHLRLDLRSKAAITAIFLTFCKGTGLSH